MKTKSPIEIFDSRHQPEHKTPKKVHLFQENGADPVKARLFLNLNQTKRN